MLILLFGKAIKLQFLDKSMGAEMSKNMGEGGEFYDSTLSTVFAWILMI